MKENTKPRMRESRASPTFMWNKVARIAQDMTVLARRPEVHQRVGIRSSRGVWSSSSAVSSVCFLNQPLGSKASLEKDMSRRGVRLINKTFESGHTLDNGDNGESNVGERVQQHDHDARPQEPVSGRRSVGVGLGIGEGHRDVGDERIFLTGGATEGLASVDNERGHDTPGQDRSAD